MGLLSTFGAASGRAFGLTRLSAAIKDAYFNLTTLLLPGNGTNGAQNNTFLDSSSNNFTITRNGNTTQGTFSPFSQTGWSNYFDGSGDYLTVPDNAAFDLSGDFCIECWAFNNNFSANGSPVASQSLVSGTNSSNNWLFFLGDTGNINFYWNTSSIISASVTHIANAWVHYAVTRSGSTIRLFRNGELLSTATNSSSFTFSNSVLFIGAQNSGAGFINGYISNLRIVTGSAVYTSAFTPSTTPLTAITGTQLLVCQDNRFRDASSNAFAVTVNGNVSVQAFSPFAPTSAYSAATNGGSGYFDGAGDYLSIADNAAWDITSSGFTVEAWVYITANGASNPSSELSQIIASQWVSYSGNSSWTLGMQMPGSSTGVKVQFFVGTTGAVSATEVTKNAWHHIAGVYDGSSTIAVYMDGVRLASTAYSSTLALAAPLLVGRLNTLSDGYQNPLYGYISNLRVSNTARYSGASYTVPSAPFTAITNTSLLLNFTNGGIIDATGKNVLETVGNAQISTTQSKFGGSSMYFDGTGDYLPLPASPNMILGSTFTIECWMYISSLAAFNPIWFSGTSSSDNSRIQAGVLTTGAIRFYADNGGSDALVCDTPTSTVTTGQWYYLAFTFTGGTGKIYVNGTQQASTAATQSLPTPNTFIVGAARSGGALVSTNGYIDDFRVTKGYVRTITTPTAAFPLQ